MAKTKLSEPKIIRVLEIMRAAEDRCRRILSELAIAQTDISSDSLISDLDLGKYYDNLLRVVGMALFEVSRCFAKKRANISLYFWPGYNSILGDDAPRRIQIIPKRFPYIPGGIGFESTSVTTDYFNFIDYIRDYNYSEEPMGDYDLSHTSLWFHCVLTSHEGDVFTDGTPFIVGGTHHWV